MLFLYVSQLAGFEKYAFFMQAHFWHFVSGIITFYENLHGAKTYIFVTSNMTFVTRRKSHSRTRGVAKTGNRVPTLGGRHYFFLLLMQRGASISHFFHPSQLKRLILIPSRVRAGGRPPGLLRVARASFGAMAVWSRKHIFAFAVAHRRANLGLRPLTGSCARSALCI